MPFELIAFALLRLVAPLAILRWPFWGAVFVVLVDSFDVAIFSGSITAISADDVYHRFDKPFDIYSLCFELYAVSKLSESKARTLLTTLFSWRILGVLMFEITGTRYFLFLAPNIFEYLYLLVYGLKEFKVDWPFESRKHLLILFVIAAVPKIIFEYVMHYQLYPLGFSNTWRVIHQWLAQ